MALINVMLGWTLVPKGEAMDTAVVEEVLPSLGAKPGEMQDGQEPTVEQVVLHVAHSQTSAMGYPKMCLDHLLGIWT